MNGHLPVMILKEGSSRARSGDAQMNSISAATSISDVLKTTLGPKGMNKMLVDSIGDTVITSDGATILQEMEIGHPSAKLMVEIAKTQDQEVGDGTTTAVILAGELLKGSQDLLNQGLHPTTIISGYKKAYDEVIKTLNEIQEQIDTDEETLKKVAITSLNTKLSTELSEHLAKIVVRAVKLIAEKKGDKFDIDVDDVVLQKKSGDSLNNTTLVSGIVIEEAAVGAAGGCGPGCTVCPGGSSSVSSMNRVVFPNIVLLNTPLKIKKTETTSKIQIKDPTIMTMFLDKEAEMLKSMIKKVKDVGGNVIVSQKEVDETLYSFLTEEGILAIQNTPKDDMEKVAKATGGKILTVLNDLTPEDIGHATLIEERKVGKDKMIFIEGCLNPKALTILIRGSTQKIIEDAERAVHDAISVVVDVFKDNYVVSGGGAVEIELAKELRGYASSISGRDQLAVIAYSEALEMIPKTLANNAGLDTINTIVSLRSMHENGKKQFGINVFNGQVEDMMKLGVIDPVSVKLQAFKSATESVEMILRVDDVIDAGKLSGVSSMPTGGMPGMM